MTRHNLAAIAGRDKRLPLPVFAATAHSGGNRQAWFWQMKIKVVVHEAEEGGFWAEVPALPGCASQGETMDELMQNLHEAIEGCLSVDIAETELTGKERVFEIAI